MIELHLWRAARSGLQVALISLVLIVFELMVLGATSAFALKPITVNSELERLEITDRKSVV